MRCATLELGHYLGFRKSACSFQVGLDYEMVYSLNDQYVRHIESLTSYNEVLAAIEAADVDMAMRCREMVDAKMTAPVSKVFGS